VRLNRNLILILLTLSTASLLAACANSPQGQAMEDVLAPDPQLQAGESDSDDTTELSTKIELPNDFPAEIPRYESALLESVGDETGQVVTTWASSDPINAIESFYSSQLATNDWKILSQKTEEQTTTLVAQRQQLQVKVVIKPSLEPSTTQLMISYPSTNTTASATPSATPTPTSATPNASASFSDLDRAPEQLRSYITDLATLGVLSASGGKSDTFEPDKNITRREYVRWLLAANNKIYASTPAKQLRAATNSSKPAFADVPTTDADFGLIQGLAEAGILPSSLSGDDTATKFRPDEPLLREDLIRWKVPLDFRRALPNATIDTVKDTWGFQDVARIDPKALKAILADFQNSDAANIRRAFGYTTLFQPKKTVTRAEAAATLWHFGFQGEGQSVKDLLDVKEK
jgi:S-layer homology domain